MKVNEYSTYVKLIRHVVSYYKDDKQTGKTEAAKLPGFLCTPPGRLHIALVLSYSYKHLRQGREPAPLWLKEICISSSLILKLPFLLILAWKPTKI